MDLQLRDTVAMVVGATGGIGSAVARAFAGEGSRLALVGRDAGKLEALERDLRARCDADAASFTCDLEYPDQIEACVQKAEAHFGRIDVLAMCAGNARRGGLEEVADADFESTWRVKLMGPVRLVRALLPGMRDRGYGRIVLIGGLGGRNPTGQDVVGGHVNAGLANFGRQMAKSTARAGITANVVDPHYTETDRWERRLQMMQERQGISREEAYTRAANVLPIGRPVRPEEIADLVLFLASRRASAITGAVIPVDGGSTQGLY